MGTRPLPFSLLLALLACPAACDSSGGDDGSMFATKDNTSVLTAAVGAVVAESKGGSMVHPPPPSGASCDRGQYRYTLVLATGALSWERCAVAGEGTSASDYTVEPGSRTLTASERTAAVEAVRVVRVSTEDTCGADKPMLNLEVWAGQSSLVYGDGFYRCLQIYEHHVESEGLDDLVAILSALAH